MGPPEYKRDLESRYWSYWRNQFGNAGDRVLRDQTEGVGPPVFQKKHQGLNVLVASEDTPDADRIRGEISPASRHHWFRSFNSSQALAQTVFANLKHSKMLGLLGELQDDDGLPVFASGSQGPTTMAMEFEVTYLGEVKDRSTEVDVLLGGYDEEYRICVECKFTESEIGTCSRPRLTKSDAGYCDGSFSSQQGRKERCSLSEQGIKYWDYLPELLGWRNDLDHRECPLKLTYQLARNILAACVQENGELDIESGHAVLLYDNRNPAFQTDGVGDQAWQRLRRDLLKPTLLRRTSWQDLTELLRGDAKLNWLASALSEKYGF